MAFSKMEPFGSTSDYFRTGIIASTLINLKRDPRKGKPVKPEDFVPRIRAAPSQAASGLDDASARAALSAVFPSAKAKKQNAGKHKLRDQGRKRNGAPS